MANPRCLLLFANHQKSSHAPDKPKEVGRKQGHAHSIRSSSRHYYARLRVKGKLIRESCKLDMVSVAQLRLADVAVPFGAFACTPIFVSARNPLARIGQRFHI